LGVSFSTFAIVGGQAGGRNCREKKKQRGFPLLFFYFSRKKNVATKVFNIVLFYDAKSRLVDIKIPENVKPESVHVVIMSYTKLGIPISCLGQERNIKYNFIGVKNENRGHMKNGQVVEVLTVLKKESHEKDSMMFGVHKLEDKCVIKTCGNNENNFLLVLGVDLVVEILNQELNQKKQILGLKYSYAEIQKYTCFTEVEIQCILITTHCFFSTYVQHQYTFCFEKLNKMLSLVGSDFININFHGQLDGQDQTPRSGGHYGA
jgi:hypothetical protein